jgi:hypothetical protein
MAETNNCKAQIGNSKRLSKLIPVKRPKVPPENEIRKPAY